MAKGSGPALCFPTSHHCSVFHDDQTGDVRPSLQMGHLIGFPNWPASLSFTCADLLQSAVREMNCLQSERSDLDTTL